VTVGRIESSGDWNCGRSFFGKSEEGDGARDKGETSFGSDEKTLSGAIENKVQCGGLQVVLPRSLRPSGIVKPREGESERGSFLV
jgi:hypothetical protein